MIKQLKQPDGSKTCGQHVVAMLCGTTVNDAIQLVGKCGGTYHHDLTPVMRQYGWEPQSDQLTRFRRGDVVPNVCLIKVWWNRSNTTHWVLKHNDRLHDPIVDFPIPWSDKYLGFNRTPDQHRMTSYIELKYIGI